MSGLLLTSSIPISTAGSCPNPPGHDPLKGKSPNSQTSTISDSTEVIELLRANSSMTDGAVTVESSWLYNPEDGVVSTVGVKIVSVNRTLRA